MGDGAHSLLIAGFGTLFRPNARPSLRKVPANGAATKETLSCLHSSLFSFLHSFSLWGLWPAATTPRMGARAPPLTDAPTQFDVAESAARFAFDEAPVFEDGFPAYGNAFVTQGYIYPHGFLDDHEGIASDGGPAYPEMVIGEWTCRGWFIGNGARTVTGPWVITTQHYDLYDVPGYEAGKATGWNNLVSEGYEVADVDTVIRRPISAGTGVFRGAVGAVDQVLLGFNATEGVNLRFTLDIDARMSSQL